MVELLIASNIARYTEFKSVTRVLTQVQYTLGLELVCSSCPERAGLEVNPLFGAAVCSFYLGGSLLSKFIPLVGRTGPDSTTKLVYCSDLCTESVKEIPRELRQKGGSP